MEGIAPLNARKISPYKKVHMCVKKFRHNLSTTLMPQTFEGFNNLCTKEHNIEIHLNKRKQEPSKKW